MICILSELFLHFFLSQSNLTHWRRRLCFIVVPVDVDVAVIVELLFPVGAVLSFRIPVPISEAVFL
jgi:hypothetical protein